MIATRPGCDLDAALRSVEGDSELLKELALIFLEESGKMKTAVRNAVESSDADALMRAAHNVKGSVANFAAEGAREAAHRLELMGRGNDLQGVHAAYVEFVDEIQMVEAELREYTVR